MEGLRSAREYDILRNVRIREWLGGKKYEETDGGRMHILDCGTDCVYCGDEHQ